MPCLTTTKRRRESDPAARARAWRTGSLRACCDRVEPWQHGTIFRATRYPSYYDLNVVLVEEPTAKTVAELCAAADAALAGLDHRLVEFTVASHAEPRREEFERREWRSLRLVWMRHVDDAPAVPAADVEEVPYEAVDDLRVRWHHEDFPGVDPSAFHLQAREVAMKRGARILAVREGGDALAFAQLEHDGQSAEITEVYVRRDHRGRGLGTAVTAAAITAARAEGDLWIIADDEARAKDLYARLGFRAVAKTMQFLRLPG
jgi:ribosomal protein S18 acetylase RimI-like enzyme